ncbi:MAG: TolC family protein [Cyclobacteriaceae bacterium]|nr:TolC family protein [Cyclobacteriaceae bacterium]
MRKLMLIFMMFPMLIEAECQVVNYSVVIPPKSAAGLSIEERLVQLAWNNNPENSIAEKKVELSRLDLKAANFRFLDIVRISSNINEFVLNPSQDVNNRADFYPLYNIGLSLPLSMFSDNPINVKKSKVSLSIAQDQVKAQMLRVRSETLRLYTLYVLAEEKLRVQQDAEQNSYANVRLVEENFKKGVESLLSYNSTLERYTNHKLRRMDAEVEVRLAKIRIEEVIGVPLETVISR